MTLRRGALWGLLLAKAVAGIGVGWDIRWHVVIGRDSFWIAPHVMTYAGVAAAAILSFGVLVFETWSTNAATRRRGTVGEDAEDGRARRASACLSSERARPSSASSPAVPLLRVAGL